MSPMADITAKDVQALRQATGAGMMDAKRALVEAHGDMDRAKKILREKGLAKMESRQRESAQGAIALAVNTHAVALVELKCETDFVAKSDNFVNLTEELADAVATRGEAGVDAHKQAVDDLKVTLRENVDVGRTQRLEVEPDQVLGTYLHRQEGRGVNGVAVVLDGGSEELAHDIAMHIAFAKPEYLRRDEVPAEVIAELRDTFTNMARAEGKPEAAWEKIVDGRLGGWYKERVLLDQPFVRDEKQTIGQLATNAGASVARFGQLFIGG
jgi:elongation factor Ts